MADQIIIDGDSIQQGLQIVYDGIEASLQSADYSVPLQLIAKEIERFEESLFAGEHAPDGTAWAPLKPATVKRKGHDVILHETGRLGTSLFQQTGDSIRDVESNFLTFGTDVPYSGFLDAGTSRMAARPHVGLNDETVDLVAEYIADGAVVALGDIP